MSSTANQTQSSLFSSHYEEEFLVRTLGDLVRRPEVALCELVANAWDAGASRVHVTIPESYEGELVVDDDGCGLTQEQFDKRWMTLGYNRQKNQGGEVEFPPGRQGRRSAYGRNGQGRHGLLCFAPDYEVRTKRDGRCLKFRVRSSSGDQPFVSTLVEDGQESGYGTRVSVRPQRNLPNPARMRELLSAKFLHDPGFDVIVNGEALPLTELPGFGGETVLDVKDPETGRAARIHLAMFEGEAGRTIHQSGVAFWVGSRLVGEPGWVVMGQPVLDGRTRPGRRLTFVVKSDDLLDDVLPDWTDFRHNSMVAEVGRVVAEAVIEKLRGMYAARVRETTAEVIEDHRSAMESLGRGERIEVAEVAQSIAQANPLVSPGVLSAAVSGVIDAKKNASLQSLMRKIECMPADDLVGLNRLLEEWSIRDALTVLDEIGRRIEVIEAMQKLMAEASVDELQVLHPLVTQARWLFGPEYDSSEYSSNLSLKNAVAKVFKVDAPGSAFKNPRKRPDLLIGPDSSVAAVATEDVDSESSLVTCRRVLLVELKRGGFRIGRDEIMQAEGYVEDLLHSGFIAGEPFIHAFVVGHEIDAKTTRVRRVGDAPERGRVEAVTFGQLVATANARLFRIRDQVEHRYPSGTEELLAHLRGDPKTEEQLGMDFSAE